MTPVTPKKWARRISHKSPRLAISPGVVQASHISVVNDQEVEIHALDILELLRDISSQLEAMHYYIQTHQKAEKLT